MRPIGMRLFAWTFQVRKTETGARMEHYVDRIVRRYSRLARRRAAIVDSMEV